MMITNSRKAKSKNTLTNINQEEGNEESESASDGAVSGKEKDGVSVIRDGFSDRGFGVRYSERRICIVCNTPGGQLLNCSNKGCLLAFHGSFMNDPSFDEKGDFYCPYCWYRMKVEQEEKLRERVLLAQRNLLEFLNYTEHDDVDKRGEGGGEDRREGSGVSPHVEDEDPNAGEAEVNVNNVEDQLVPVENDKMDDGIEEKSGDGDQCGVVVKPVRRSDEVDFRISVTKGPKDTDNGRMSGKEKSSETPEIEIPGEGRAKEDAGQANGREKDIHSEKQHPEEGEDKENEMDQEEAVNSTDQEEEQHTLECDSGSHISDTETETPSVRITRARQKILEAKEAQNVNLTDQEEKVQHTLECDNGSDISDTETETLSVRITRARQKTLKAKEVQNVSFPKKSTPQAKLTSDGKAKNGNKKPIASKRLRTAEEECSQKRNNNIDTRKKPRLVQESPKKFSSTTNSDGRRKKLLWTSEEEEMLKEGVGKFSNAVNRNMPWRKILEFGRHVFDPSRTPADLKDKWRNMLS